MNKKSALVTVICTTLSASAVGLTGCEYPEDDSSQSQQSAVPAQEPATSNGSRSDFSGAYSGNPSALAGAKKGAESVISSAEQASQNVANQADELMKPDR